MASSRTDISPRLPTGFAFFRRYFGSYARGRPPPSPRCGHGRGACAGRMRGVLTRDPEEKDSFPLPAGTRGAKQAPRPSAAPAAPRRKAKPAAGSEISPGAPSDAEIRAELKQMEKAVKAFKRGSRGSATAA